jgi:hypothetical protein
MIPQHDYERLLQEHWRRVEHCNEHAWKFQQQGEGMMTKIIKFTKNIICRLNTK